MNRNEYNIGFNSYMIKRFSPGNNDILDDENEIAYHYTSPEAFLSIIQKQTIRFTDIRYLNDKSEGVYFVKLLLDFIDKNKGAYQYFEEAVNALLKGNTYEKITSLETTNIEYTEIQYMPYKPVRVFVFCTCSEPDSLNMWNYYVNNSSYQGYNIGFKVKELLKTFNTTDAKKLDSFVVYYGNVLYSEKDQFNEIRQIAEKIEKGVAKNAEGGEHSKQRGLHYVQLWLRNYIDSRGAFYKHPKFESEREFRIVIEISEERIPKVSGNNNFSGFYNKTIFEGFAAKRGLIVPYLNIQFPKDAISRITVAPMIEYVIAKSSIKELLEANRIKGAKIYKSIIPIRF